MNNVNEARIILLEKQLAQMRALLGEVARRQAWPQYITRNELAEMLQISPRTIDDWVRESRIPYHKAGNQTRFLVNEIVEWTAGQWKERDGGAQVGRKSRPARKRPARSADDNQPPLAI